MEAISSLREQKEAFVTGHEGGTPWEVLLVCLSAPIGLSCVRSVTATIRPTSPWAHVVLEAMAVWFPMVLCQTNYLYPYGVGLLVALLRIDHMFGSSGQPGEVESGKNGDDNNNNNNSDDQNTDSTLEATTVTLDKTTQPPLDYLTAYRSSILYLTFIAILAVDFHVFPRRFCKTEITGFGLMDVGAASFCLSAGLVSPKARSRRGCREMAGGDAAPTTVQLIKPLIHTLPLVLLGVIRIITNRELDYQEHVSEYGVHWNFFFTMGILALVPPLMSIFEDTTATRKSGSIPRWWKPAIIMGMYQAALSLGGVQEFIVTAPRQLDTNDDAETHRSVLGRTAANILAANREGILGCVGYLSLFFFGEWVGYEHVWNSNKVGQSSSSSGWLWKIAMILWTLLAGLYWGLDIPVSRRSTNLPFCIWAAAHNIVLLAFLQWSTVQSTTLTPAASTSIPPKRTSRTTRTVPIVWETVNRYGLFMFLIANLLTGLVNLTIPTLEMSDPVALLIVFVYLCTVGMAALLLDVIWMRWKKNKHKPKVD
jgi:glucosaminylphosphatidylinositol acyltransferase